MVLYHFPMPLFVQWCESGLSTPRHHLLLGVGVVVGEGPFVQVRGEGFGCLVVDAVTVSVDGEAGGVEVELGGVVGWGGEGHWKGMNGEGGEHEGGM